MSIGKLNISQTANNRYRYLQVFSLLWLVTFILYYPAARSGMVGDFPYYVQDIKQQSLWEYINPRHSLVLYQTMKLTMYVLYKLFGLHPWLWHLVYVTLHALNGLLLFILFSTLLLDSKIKNGVFIPFAAVCLFIICPHASEAVVWKPANHFLLVPALIFLTLVIVQRFHKKQKAWYAILSGFLFFYSSFSLEFFYLTPWLVLLLICYYRFVLDYDKVIFRKAIYWFFIPLTALFIVNLLLLRIQSNTFLSHYGNMPVQPLLYYLDKPIKYVYHVIFFGRFFPHETRDKIYRLCESKKAIFLFYGLFTGFWIYVLYRFKQVSIKLKLLALIAAYTLLTYLFLAPLLFADLFLVDLDRYTYLANGFAYMLLVLLISFISLRLLQFLILGTYAIINLWFTVKVSRYWQESTNIIDHLMSDMPYPGNKTVILLNVPDDLNGIPMIAAEPEGRFKTMVNEMTSHPLKNNVYDAVAYNMLTEEDGAHVMVINDSMLHVTLNQWGTWWHYGLLGASSYENEDYKLNMADVGHWYELTLKHPVSQYLLLYQVGSQWKIVDWNKKNVDQY